jgi:hypothetical protein
MSSTSKIVGRIAIVFVIVVVKVVFLAATRH